MSRPNTIMDIWGRLELQENGCALWPGAAAHNGYGVIRYQGKHRKVHRILYEYCVGPVPDGCELDHLCRTPLCANFAHLEAVSHQVNVLRGTSLSAENARKTH